MPNSKRTKQRAYTILIALLMTLSLVANAGAVVMDLTPVSAKPGDTVSILSFEIVGPEGGTTLTSVYVAYTGTDPADVKSAEILVDGNPFGTYTGDFVPPCIIPSSDPGGYPLPEGVTVVVSLQFELMDSAVDGNWVDGKISAYTTGDPCGEGTDEAPIEPAGNTLIARAHRLNITSDPLELTAGISGTMTVEVQHESGASQPVGEYVVNLASSASSGKYYFYATGTTDVITSITIPNGASSAIFDYNDEEAGTPTITVSDADAILLPDEQVQTVNPAALHHLIIEGEPSITMAGEPFPAPIVVTTYDVFGNVKTDYIGTVTFTSTDPTAVLPVSYTFLEVENGVHSFAGGGFVLKTAGTQTITVADGAKSDTTGDITVNPEEAYALVITSESLVLTAGTSGTMTVQVQDEFGNAQPDGEYYVDLASDSSAHLFYTTGTSVEITSITIADGFSSAIFDYYDTLVGTPTITVSDGLLSDSQIQTVNPAAAFKLQILVPGEMAAPGTATGKTGSPTAQEVGQPFDVVVNAVDEYWNINPDGVATVEITTTDPDDIEPAQADLVAGTEPFSVTFITMGEWTITATDIDGYPLPADTSPPITVNPGPATHLHVYEITDPVTAGVDSGVTVEAMDEFDNRATGYTGTIQFASSDIGTATTLPGEYTFTASDAGIKVFDGVTMDQIVKLTTAGEHWVSATDNIEYSYSTTVGNQPVSIVVEDTGTHITWTIDYPLEAPFEETEGNGLMTVGLVIALDGDGEGPAFQIHNNDGSTLVEPHGTWMYGYWGPTINDGWNGWPNHDLDMSIAGFDWVTCSGERKNADNPDGIFTISIDRSELGDDFHWALNLAIGTGFTTLTYEQMSYPVGVTPWFDWGNPLVNDAMPNYEHGILNIWGEQTDITVEPADPAYVDVSASSASVLVGDEAMITATVTDAFGNFVPETEVSFETDLVTGTIWPPTDETENGIAQTSIFSTDVGTATVTATAGSVSGFCTITFVEQTLEIELSLGWNLISVPRTLANPAIEEVFAETTTVEKVYTYHEGMWNATFFDDGELQPGYTLNEIVDGNGYWVYTSEPTNVTIYLKPLGYMETPPSYPLPAEWSLIGYTSVQLNPKMSIDNYLGYLTWNTLYRFHPDTRMYEIAKPDFFGFDYTELGRGYWIHLNAAGDLVP